jgi:hypothetical protein
MNSIMNMKARWKVLSMIEDEITTTKYRCLTALQQDYRIAAGLRKAIIVYLPVIVLPYGKLFNMLLTPRLAKLLLRCPRYLIFEYRGSFEAPRMRLLRHID